jgi:excisionase family DNA binding protein
MISPMWDLLLRIDEAAALTRRAASTIRSWIHRGLLKATKQGRRVVVRLADVLELEARTNATRAKRGGRAPACVI